MNRLFRLSLIVLTALGTTFPSAGLAQAVDPPTRSTPYKIAIFPFGGPEQCHGHNRPLNREVASEVRGLIKQNESLSVRYSYYDGAMNEPPIMKADKLWSGSKPNVNFAYTLGEKYAVDAIVMYWRPSEGWGFGGYCTDRQPPYPIKVYLIDVKQQKTYSLKGREKDLSGLTKQAFSKFIAARPERLAAAKGQSVPRPTQPAPQTTPYRIAIFPFEGTTCVGQNRPTDEKFAAELGALIAKNDSLKLAYSYYDKNLNQPPIRKPGQLWAGSRPNVARVSSLGEAHRVDAVVMYWRPSTGIGYCTDRLPPYPIHMYIIDVTQRKTYWLKGREKNLSGLTEQTFSKFIAARPERLASVKQPSVPPPSPPIGAQAGDWTINYCKDLTVDEFHEAAKWAFQKRKYVIEEDTPSSLTGAQKGKMVEVSMTAPGQIVIRWVPGFGYHKDDWLKYLWREVSVALAD